VPSTEGIPALYRHRVVLRFEGDYAAALDYVRAVEALPFRVRLHDLDVDAERWPALTITLTVETLGLQEGWIGV
jgi:MSHA biogenesis protein MshJ